MSLASFVGEALPNSSHTQRVLKVLEVELITTKEELVECFEEVKGSLPALARKRLADHIVLQSPDVMEMMKQATDARAKLAMWDHKASDGNWNQFGGLEGICTLLRIASLDRDGDGKITSEELQRFEETSVKLIDDAATLLTNTGVVSALVLTMFVPIELAEPSSDTLETFHTGANVLMYFSFVFDMLVVACALVLVFMSALVLLFLSNLPSHKAKLEYLRGSSSAFQFQAVTMYVELFTCALSIFFRGLLESPKVGFAAVLPIMFVTLWFLKWALPSLGKCSDLASAETRALLGPASKALLPMSQRAPA